MCIRDSSANCNIINPSCGEIEMVILFYGYIANGAKNLELRVIQYHNNKTGDVSK